MTATAAEPTLLEELHALEVTAHRLATERDNAVAERADLLETNRRLQAERDAALKMAAQATKDLVQVRRETKAQLDLRDALIDSLRINDDRKNDDLRRLNARVRELAVENEGLSKRFDQDQRKPLAERDSWLTRLIRRIRNRI